MSLTEDEKLCQMIWDFIENDVAPPPDPIPVEHKSSIESLQGIIESVTVPEAQILEKVLKHRKDLDPAKLRKWIVEQLGKDDLEASLCRTSWQTKTAFKHTSVSKYEYIEVRKKGDKEGDKAVRLIIDMDFRSQFELSRPTEEYRMVTSSLPEVFVGTEEKLIKIIDLACPAAKKSLRERGFYIPPWRKARHMRAKWLAKDCLKVPFESPEIMVHS